MHAQNCWLVVVAVACGLNNYKDTNHTDLSDDLVFDVFPETLDGFHDLVLVDLDSYRLGWDESFPTLQDGDGDGLISALAGGPDPDDSLPDTDGDGLSDYFEIYNLFDATSPDGDADGLTDYWEAYFLTNPYKGDTDGDGLLDSEECSIPTGFIHTITAPSATTIRRLTRRARRCTWAGGNWSIRLTGRRP